ncbi:MAG: hypothetical protein F4X56_00990 [Gammaproteobacteria bacterium]|nr:hypothetical protein [Gammaproteobacteria bacterium]MYC24476.1 hypothetical protein [Gammaproteobacteria bacterium]
MRELSLSALVLTLLISGCATVNGPTAESEPAPIESSTTDTAEESNTQEANEDAQPRRDSQLTLMKVIRWGVLGYLGVGLCVYWFIEGIWN